MKTQERMDIYKLGNVFSLKTESLFAIIIAQLNKTRSHGNCAITHKLTETELGTKYEIMNIML